MRCPVVAGREVAGRVARRGLVREGGSGEREQRHRGGGELLCAARGVWWTFMRCGGGTVQLRDFYAMRGLYIAMRTDSWDV